MLSGDPSIVFTACRSAFERSWKFLEFRSGSTLLLFNARVLRVTDFDGTNDSLDAFPLDSSEYLDTDSDGIGDNSDECPDDPRGSVDKDGDKICDESDPFPDNPNEWKDSDGDGYGDNSDAFPNDPLKSLDYEEIAVEPQIEGGLLDSSMIVILALGSVYFMFKKFTS